MIYGQRTADDRLAFGSRGNYFYGSRTFDRFSADDPSFAIVQRNAEALFPVLRDFRITHRWGGPLGISRNWQPKVGIDRAAGFAWIGGYAGEGVAASNLAGRTLAELIVERDSERTALPLVGPPFPNWEPEPPALDRGDRGEEARSFSRQSRALRAAHAEAARQDLQGVRAQVRL